MKSEEAKEIITDSRAFTPASVYTVGEEVEALGLAAHALDKATPRPVCYESDGYADGGPVYDMAICPACDYRFEDYESAWGEPFCPHCGQALKWDPEEDEEEGADK